LRSFTGQAAFQSTPANTHIHTEMNTLPGYSGMQATNNQ